MSLSDPYSFLFRELKLNEEKLKTTNAKLKEFSSLAAHELKVPIDLVIEDAKKLSENNKLDLGVKKNIDLISKNAQRSRTTIDQILTLAKSEVKGNLVLEQIDLNKLIKEIVELEMAPLAKKKNIEIHLNLKKIPNVYADEIRMIEIINNLINNAIKYTDEKGTIDIKTFKGKSSVVFEVKDSGIGISKENISKLFKKFYVVKKGKASTGLGLSFVKGIIEQHEGEVGLKSDGLGKGSVFWFSLPIKKILGGTASSVKPATPAKTIVKK